MLTKALPSWIGALLNHLVPISPRPLLIDILRRLLHQAQQQHIDAQKQLQLVSPPLARQDLSSLSRSCKNTATSADKRKRSPKKDVNDGILCEAWLHTCFKGPWSKFGHRGHWRVFQFFYLLSTNTDWETLVSYSFRPVSLPNAVHLHYILSPQSRQSFKWSWWTSHQICRRSRLDQKVYQVGVRLLKNSRCREVEQGPSIGRPQLQRSAGPYRLSCSDQWLCTTRLSRTCCVPLANCCRSGLFLFSHSSYNSYLSSNLLPDAKIYTADPIDLHGRSSYYARLRALQYWLSSWPGQHFRCWSNVSSMVPLSSRGYAQIQSRTWRHWLFQLCICLGCTAIPWTELSFQISESVPRSFKDVAASVFFTGAM